MSPTTLPPHLVDLVLQYISPPSQLTQPLPPHLISGSLLQRHHFLQLTVDEPTEYLCWPSPNQEKCIELLEHLPKPANDDDYINCPVQYTSDGDHVYAHAGIDSLRVIYQWQPEHGWKFHDLNLMPFPPDSFSSPLAAMSWDIHAGSSDTVDGSDTADSDGDYWNSYGGDGEFGEPLGRLISAAKDDMESEDSYWAQYSTIQGSGDSTIPSPSPKRKNLPPQMPIELPGQRVLPQSTQAVGPPSPNTLAHLISQASPRASRSPSPILFAPPERPVDVDIVPSSLLSDMDVAEVVLSSSLPGTDPVDIPCQPSEAVDEATTAFRSTIKGVYGMWRAAAHVQRRHNVSDAEDRDAFLRVVQETIAGL